MTKIKTHDIRKWLRDDVGDDDGAMLEQALEIIADIINDPAPQHEIDWVINSVSASRAA
jgi:hypothetical protein